jgi:hypothetical protein
MNTIGRFLLLYILHPVFFVSCAKTESQEIAQPDPRPTDSTVNKPVETGTVVGAVVLYNLDKRTYPIGMTITLYNSKDTIRQTISSMSEIFQMEKVPLGIYSIRYERDSMGTSYAFGANINLANQTNLLREMNFGYKSLGSLSYFHIDTSEAYRGSWNFRQVMVPKPKMIYESTVRYFASTSSDISYQRFDTSWALTYGSFGMDTLENSLDYRFFERLGFTSGEKIYIKAYSDGFYPNAYYDPVQKRMVYPNINLASPPIDSFVFRK